jgi:hypothetical protein
LTVLPLAKAPWTAVNALKDPQEPMLRWFLESLEAAQGVEGILRNLVLDLRHSLASRTLEPDLRREMEQQLRLLEKAVGRVCQLQTRAADVLRTLREHPEEPGGGSRSNRR